MRARRIVLAFLIFAPILMGLAIAPTNHTRNAAMGNREADLVLTDGEYEATKNAFTLSQENREGVLNPIRMTQRGYQETSLVRARTDTGKNTQQNITIDEANGWAASRTEIDVSNLRKLYALNGTFDDEVDPWVSSTYDPSGGAQVQSAVWNDTNGYVTCVNYGELETHPVQDDTYTHYLDSEILWEQTVTNSPQTNLFSLSFDYRYVSGPVDLEPYDFSGDVELRIYVHTDTYYMSIATGDLRGVWYSITNYPINMTGAPVSFDVGIGIYIEYANLVLTENGDYDDDSVPDGLINAQKIEVNIDDVEFTSRTPPSYAGVSLTLNVGGFTSPISGPTGGVGTSTISNSLLWDVDPLQMEVTANNSVAFDYYMTIYFQRDLNSSWTTHLSMHGVSYTTDAGQSTDLEMYTYVTTSTDYQNLTLSIDYPSDWDNATIWDPLNNDITGLCTISTGSIYVPNSLFSRVGWWKLTYQAFNYAKDISIQMQDGYFGDWTENSLFRTGNITRTQVEIGTSSVTPGAGAPVSIQWIMPNGTIWASDSISDIINGHANSSSWVFAGTNTSAGEWTVEVFWNNGTEVAYGYALFDLYHQASVAANYPLIEADYGQVISNLITFRDVDTGNYLLDDSVSIVANWSSTAVIFTQNYAKNWWEADFDTSLIGSGEFIVVVNASMPYFDTVVTQFIVVSVFQTALEILNAGSLPVQTGLNEIFSVQLSYRLLNGSGVAGATLSVIFSGPVGGLSWQSFADYGNGSYSLDVACNISEIYEVTITLSKTFHYDATDSFTLIIGETGSELELLNGTADVVLFGNNYRLVVEYRNSTGHGLSGANLQILTVTPAAGLSYGNFTLVSEGCYEIILTPASAVTFSIVVRADILNHETQYATFTLTASGIPTILTSLPSSATVAMNQTFTLQLRFQDESFNTIDIASIALINPPSGVTVSGAVSVGDGLYNVTVQSAEIRTFDLLFRATASNYQSSSAGFTLVVTEIQTTLRFEGDVTSTTAAFGEPYELVVYYERMSPSAAIQGANITVLPSDIMDLQIQIVEYSGFYIISIRGNAIGSWVLSVVANKTDFRIATKQFFIEVERIDATAQGSSPLEAILVGRSYTFTFSYIFESNSSYIRGASVLASGEGADWISVLELGSGQYSVSLTPQELGEHFVVLTFERTGFETASYRLMFTVDRVPITVQVLQGLNAPELSQSTILVRLSEIGTGSPVSGVQVFCYIIDPNGAPSDSIPMDATSTAGEYNAVISMPAAEGVYLLQITCDAENYVLEPAYSVQLQPGRDALTMLWLTTIRYYPFMFLPAVLGVALVFRRRARRRRIRENKEALAVKRRFDGVKSLLGVIVLHKESGLPVYSKILRVGLEETVISAFITAITSFRGEFDIESDSEEWGLIPISDIVRVISTNRLVCAFITTGNPSPEQRERMIRFAKTVAFIFDETLHDVPIIVLDMHTKTQFDTLFEDILDGALLRTYKLDEAKKFPTNTCALERIARKQGVEFKLEELASEIATCGLEEGRVYKAIMTALENHYLVTTDESPFTADLIRASETVEDES
ncbi:MAG: hypothetical protein C4K48_03565 [Candidatus Thorarchaeota archaeon]|nr:MAG: hypothetical protein C4K48_03565 [Candidatus Thorarchaeota archaeon]